MSITLRLATEEDANEWNKIVRSDPHGNFFDRFEWCQGLHIISENIKPLPLFIEKNGETIGVFPLCLRKSRFRSELESLPFSDYGGGSFFRSRYNIFFTELVHKLVEMGTQNNCFRIIIRRALFDDLIQSNIVDKPVIVEAKNCTFIISLQDEMGEIFRRIKKSRRKGIRRAKERGVTVREAVGLNDLEKFYEVYLPTMRRLKSSPLPFQFFEYLWNTFESKDEIKIFLAEYNHKVIAGILRFIYKQVMHAAGAVYLREYRNKRPLDLLIWHTIGWGIEHDVKSIDFGGTPNDPSSGHYSFKESWGGKKVTLYNYHILLQPYKYRLYKFANKLVRKI